MSDPEALNSAEDAIGLVVEAFLDRFRKGERPALTELVARHPEMAEELQAIIPALVELEQVGDSTGPLSGSWANGGGSIEGSHPGRLGDYRIIRRIGGGGMGVVYEAEHESLGSRVALKVMHVRFREDKKYLRRFHIEARAAAGLHHTNIVSVFDFGTQADVCYYAMQYIRGQPLDCVLDDLRRLRAEGLTPLASTVACLHGGPAAPANDAQRTVAQSLLTGRFVVGEPPEIAIAESRLTEAKHARGTATIDDPVSEEPETSRELPALGSSSLGGPVEGQYFREVARVCSQVADALDYAHRKGVFHRDIKPSNLLLDALGNVWVTDFGLAKLEGGEDASKSQDMVGTLRYMAPERFRGISNRSGDIYALGATLYELVTLRPAFDGADQLRLIDRIVHEPPARPRLIDRHVPRDLETIVLKALAKASTDRFGSACEMAEELRRFLAGHPIRSRPISGVERFGRWCKRNPWLAGANIAAATTTTALAIGSTILAKVYHDSREQYAAFAQEMARSETKVREELFEARASHARASRFSRQVGQRFESLDALADAVKIGRALGYSASRFDGLRDEAIASMMLPDLEPADRTIQLPDSSLECAFDDDMTRYAFRRIDGTIVVGRIDDDREIARFTAKGDRDIFVFEFSPDGRYLASRDGDTISVWDVERKSLVWTVPGVCLSYAAQFSPDSRRIAVAPSDGTILVYDLATGQYRSWTGPAEAQDLAFRPDGAEIAVGYKGTPATSGILDAETGRQLRTLSIPGGSDAVLAWSPDGSTMAIAGNYQKISIFSAARGERGATLELPLHASGGVRVAFHPAGTLLASNGWDSRLRLWDPASGRERLSLNCRGAPAFSKDGRLFVRQGNEFSLRQVDPAAEYTTLSYASSDLLNHARATIHRDGRLLAVGTDRGVIVWDLARKTELGFLPIGLAVNCMFEPSGDLLTNGSAGVLRWAVRKHPTSGEIGIGPPRVLLSPGTACGIATDRTGQMVAVAGHQDARVALGDRTIPIGPLDDCRGVSLSPDGKWLATNNHQKGGVTIWRLPDGGKVKGLPIEGGASSVFSPDGKWLATSQSTCRLWEVGSWREVRQFDGFFQSFSPDGRLGIVLDTSNILRLVEIETGRILARIERPDQQAVGWITFSPDGSRLVGTTNDPPSTQVIDLRTIRRRLSDMGLDWDAPAFSEDDAARSDLPPLPPLKVDYGFLTPQLEPNSESLEELVARYTERIKQNPDDFDAHHQRARVHSQLNRLAEAISDLTEAHRLRPGEAHILHARAQIYSGQRQWEPAVADLEAALALDSSQPPVRELLAVCSNNLAWDLSEKSRSSTDLDRALKLSLRAVELFPGQQTSLNTRGVVLYRAGRFASAITTLEKSLEAGTGKDDGFDLFFLAMAHHHLGHRKEALHFLDRAIDWTNHASALSANRAKEIAAFRAEAEAVLAEPTGELPDDVFEPPKGEARRSRP